MRLLVVLLSCGLAVVRSQPWVGDPEAVDIDHMIALLGEGGLLESDAALGDSSSSSQSIDVDRSESSYFISTGSDSIKEITVAEAADYGLTCMPAVALSQSADIIVQESDDESSLATVSSSDGAAAASATGAGTSASVSAGTGGVAASAAAGSDASAASAAAGSDASAASAAAGSDASAVSAATGTDSSAASAAAGTDASAVSAAAGTDSSAASAASGTDASAVSAAAGTDASAASAAAGTDASSASAAAGGSGAATSSTSSTEESSSSSTQLGYEIEEGDEDHLSEEVEEVGTCVPYYMCGMADIVSDGAGQIDIRLRGDDEGSKSHSECPSVDDVYCRAPLSEPNPELLRELVGEDYQPSCGRRNPDGISVLFGGFQEGETQFGEYPWMGIILEEEMFGDHVIQRYVCGASLIHPQVIMTGAHCINGKEPTKLSVRLGDWDTQNERELFPHEQHHVASTKVHERFNSGNLRYDVGLLFLEEPVVLKPHIDTICLPEENENFDYSFCVATGFGKDRFHGGRFQNIMKQVDLPIMPQRQCQNRLRQTRLGRWFRLHRTFTCAGGEDNVDTCRGDGGSPLACPSKEDPTKYVQAGIVAWGIGCGEGGVPGVYASVPRLVKWVNEKMTEHFGHTVQKASSGKYAPPV